MAAIERCTVGDWSLTREVRAPGGGGSVGESCGFDCHTICVSVFTFAGAYRASSAYARGLRWLSAAVADHLPGWVLRVYADGSVDPAAGAGSLLSAADAAEWRATFAALARAPHVCVLWFEHAATPSLRAAAGGGHVELTGCFARFLPMFSAGRAGDAAAPAWARAPPDGRVVASCDADWGEFFTEHAFLHALAWLAAAPAGGDAPQLLALAGAGSVALRHSPAVGALPPFYSGLLASRERLPAAPLDGFLRDAAAAAAGAGAGGALARYLAALATPAARASHAFARRALAG
jgi:hypothetical protein